MYDDINELKETDIWTAYQHGVDYNHQHNLYTDADKCNEMYNGNQWKGANLGNNPPVSLNYIKTIVKHKVSTVNQNLWKIVYESMNFDNEEIIQSAKRVCKLLNKKADITWERNKLDDKLKKIVRQGAIVSEGVLYNFYDEDIRDIRTQLLKKTDIIYGDENNSEIEEQPYIIIKRRMTVMKAREYARQLKCSEDVVQSIRGDNEYLEEAGEKAKYEKDNKVTVLTKLWKEKGTVWYEEGTRYCMLTKKLNTGYKRYPLQHYLWEEKEGSARGEGEVKSHIENQLEVNRTLMRRSVVGKNIAFPHAIINTDFIANKDAINKTGSTIEVKGKTVDDVRKMFGYTQVTQMSSDIKELQNELMSVDRDLSGAGDIATGSINPSTASGRAVLAVQEASTKPMIEQVSALKTLIEELALCWLDIWIATSEETMHLINEEIQDDTGESTYTVEEIPTVLVENMNATVKIEVTSKGVYDKYAKEQSLENLANSTIFQNPQLLEDYIEMLDDDSNMPKQNVLAVVKKRKERQARIAQIKAQGQLMQQQAQQYMAQQHQMAMADSMGTNTEGAEQEAPAI